MASTSYSSSSSSSKNSHHIRSISLPTRSHPTTLQIEEALYNLKTWEASTSSTPTADTICDGLIGLERLYKQVDDLLSLPLTQQVLSQGKHEKLVEELLDRSMNLLEVCGSTRYVISQIKEHLRDAQSALRRRKEDIIIDTSFTKKLKKDVQRTLTALKQIDNKIVGTPLLDVNHHLYPVIKTLRDVSAVSISLFGSFLPFLSISVTKPKSSKWSKVSRLINKWTTESKNQHNISNDLECHIEGLEDGLESVYRLLIKTRANVLNMLSH